MKTLLPLVLLLVVASPALAQTHPCDLSPSTLTVTASPTPLAVLFCARPADNLTRSDVVIDGNTSTFTEAEAVAQTAPNADGYAQYRVPIGVLPVGAYLLQVTVFNLDADGVEQVSDVSDPLSFTVLAPKPRPSKPKVTGVVK